MRYITLIALVIFAMLQSCDNQEKGITTDIVKNTKSAEGMGEEGSAPKMFFEETVHDFGDMIQGERVVYAFKFVNIGGSDLVITRVSTSCGCTVGDYPKEAVSPGKVGYIEVTFDSKNKKGFQNKTVTILANTEPNTTTLRVKTKIILPERN
jgi:uncharacterized protein DUF1573